jgi:outer membrane protein OmpA-like peptidoglycan-associated protein
MLDKLGAMLGGGSGTDSLLRKGSGLVSSLLGDRAGGIADTIGGLAGIGRSSSGSLMNLAAPLVMSVLGKLIAGRGLDAAGLMSMLMGQRSEITSALPAGLRSLFGAPDYATPRGPDRERVPVATAAREPSRHVAEEPAYREPERSSTPSWLPALALAGLALLATVLLTQRRGPEVAERAPAPPPAQTVAPAAQPPAAQATAPTPAPAPAALPRQAASATTGVLDELSSYLEEGGGAEGRRFVLDDVTFDTGSARLTDASRATVDELATLLKEHPSARIRIEGFTDSSGSAAANRQLSQQRAETVKQTLVEGGIETGRIQAQGHGPDRPVASNDTVEGRARNRRTEVVINLE